MRGYKNNGFTIVELLIVIVVVAILAAIVIIAYNGIQARAQQSKIKSDLAQLEKAIKAARTLQDKPLYNITGSGGTSYACTIKASGTDLAAVPKTDACWTAYFATLSAITDASGVNVKNLVDPWGRPYYMDENENQNAGSPCTKDVIASFRQPFVTGWSNSNAIAIDNSLPNC